MTNKLVSFLTRFCGEDMVVRLYWVSEAVMHALHIPHWHGC